MRDVVNRSPDTMGGNGSDGHLPLGGSRAPGIISREQREEAAAAAAAAAEAVSKIKVAAPSLSGVSGPAEKDWKRQPTKTGHGATHVKSFHSKLTGESLAFLDKQINEWLDAHPELEVKLVTTCVGEWMGKLKEDNIIIQVWV